MTEQVGVSANSDSIEWLLYESGISRYKISKETGISEASLSRISSGGTPIDQIRFGYASKLTEYAQLMKNYIHAESLPGNVPGDSIIIDQTLEQLQGVYDKPTDKCIGSERKGGFGDDPSI